MCDLDIMDCLLAILQDFSEPSLLAGAAHILRLLCEHPLACQQLYVREGSRA